jgi:hypothetical protein
MKCPTTEQGENENGVISSKPNISLKKYRRYENLLHNKILNRRDFYVNFVKKIDLVLERTLTWTMPRVAEVTGSEKSPPGGETAPTMLTLPSRSGLPVWKTRIKYTHRMRS